jgi:hypothetical protein
VSVCLCVYCCVDDGTVCGESDWYTINGRSGYGTLELHCRDHKKKFTHVQFADWGAF